MPNSVDVAPLSDPEALGRLSAHLMLVPEVLSPHCRRLLFIPSSILLALFLICYNSKGGSAARETGIVFTCVGSHGRIGQETSRLEEAEERRRLSRLHLSLLDFTDLKRDAIVFQVNGICVVDSHFMDTENPIKGTIIIKQNVTILLYYH